MRKHPVMFKLDDILYPEPPPEPQIKKEIKKKMKSMKTKKESEPWDPNNYDTFDETINSLRIFNDFKNEDGEKMTKKEIRESFENLDTWIEDMAIKYQNEYRQKENRNLS